jgi:hypothetical protein
MAGIDFAIMDANPVGFAYADAVIEQPSGEDDVVHFTILGSAELDTISSVSVPTVIFFIGRTGKAQVADGHIGDIVSDYIRTAGFATGVITYIISCRMDYRFTAVPAQGDPAF